MIVERKTKEKQIKMRKDESLEAVHTHTHTHHTFTKQKWKILMQRWNPSTRQREQFFIQHGIRLINHHTFIRQK